MGQKVVGLNPSAGKVLSCEVSIKYYLLFIIVYVKIMHVCDVLFNCTCFSCERLILGTQ